MSDAPAGHKKEYPGRFDRAIRYKTTPLTEKQRRVCQMWVLGLQSRKQIAEALHYNQIQRISDIVNSPVGKAYCRKLSREIEERFVALAIAKSLEAYEAVEKRKLRRFD